MAPQLQQQLHIVKARLVVGRVGGHRMLQLFQRGIGVALRQRVDGLFLRHFGFQRFGGLRALGGVDMTVARGEFRAGFVALGFVALEHHAAAIELAFERGGAGFGSCVWGSTLGPDTIVVLTVATVGDFAIDVRAKEINAATYDSYELNYTSSTHTFEIIRILNNGSTSLVNTTSITLTAGDKVAFLALGTTLAAAVFQSGAWSADILSTTDSNYALAGYVGIWANGTTPVFDDFSAATVTPMSGWA